ncbi:hypothetical protein CPC08DRAFT_685507 [Agrocybe pediades]|nr:hypothetical protein CPC08DRAFT_685507 [Agrocybe pediades]
MSKPDDVVYIDGRTVYALDLEYTRCSARTCQKGPQDGTALRVCSSCGEAAYCSSECQKTDWKDRHKAWCGKTDRVAIERYYPFLACIAYVNHCHPDIPLHPALLHQIINDPGPNNSSEIVEFPNGNSAKLVLLGTEIPVHQLNPETWWPAGRTLQIRAKFHRRIISEMYTTTYMPKPDPQSWQTFKLNTQERVRLTHRSSPICDIGIVQGSVRVTPQDRLVYYSMTSHEFIMGDDPDDHYWMYFTTRSGNEYFLDIGMFTFNCAQMVKCEAYSNHGFYRPMMNTVPAFFYGEDLRRTIPRLDMLAWKPKRKFSLLHDERLYEMMGYPQMDVPDKQMQGAYNIMEEIAGRKCTGFEREMLLTFTSNARMCMSLNLKHRDYLNFPEKPEIVLELDPGETINDCSEEEDRALEKYMKKWARRLKKGHISPEQWVAAFHAANEKPHANRYTKKGPLNFDILGDLRYEP